MKGQAFEVAVSIWMKLLMSPENIFVRIVIVLIIFHKLCEFLQGNDLLQMEQG